MKLMILRTKQVKHLKISNNLDKIHQMRMKKNKKISNNLDKIFRIKMKKNNLRKNIIENKKKINTHIHRIYKCKFNIVHQVHLIRISILLKKAYKILIQISKLLELIILLINSKACWLNLLHMHNMELLLFLFSEMLYLGNLTI